MQLFNVHICMSTFKKKQINSAWIAEYYENDIRMSLVWPIKTFHKKISNKLKCDVSKHSVYMAKRRVLIKINCTREIQYSRVWDYAHEVKMILSESTIKIITEDLEPGTDRGRFMRMHVCLSTLKKVFTEFYKKLVGLESCHLKGPFGGQLLAVVGVDTNDGIYLVAWAVVESETSESWTWFL